jgi:hypothetical protein
MVVVRTVAMNDGGGGGEVGNVARTVAMRERERERDTMEKNGGVY